MALMRMATAWERFVLKDLPTVGRYARVELTPPGPGELVGVVKGVGGLVKDTLTFRWATVTVKEATVNAIVLAEIAGWFFIGECIGIFLFLT